VQELSFRARRILFATVTEYIATGEPVGSRKLVKRYDLQLSPASVRNVLADLEDGGYLVQPHTSAGRIPTDRGFRTLVDALVRTDDVPQADQEALLERIERLRPGYDDIPLAACDILSEHLGGATILHAPRPEEEFLAQVRFVPLADERVLAVLVTRSGAVENRVIQVESIPSAGDLERLHNYLESLLGNRSLSQLRDCVAQEADQDRDVLKRRAREVVEAVTGVGGRPRSPHIAGRKVLLDQPDFSDVEKMRAVLDALDDKERLMELLDCTLEAGGIQVLIGSEIKLARSQDLSLISASYRQGGARTGALGLLVPTRTDYRRAVPLVGFAASLVSDMLDGDETQH